MGRKARLLSAEISRARALLAGGAQATVPLGLLREWEVRQPLRGPLRAPPPLLRWCTRLCGVIREALPLGAPLAPLLRDVHPMVRADERHWTRLQGVERQFAFQGALAVVLPWAVGGLTEGVRLNALSAAGAAIQLVGLALFTLLLRRAVRLRRDEAALLFELVTAIWMRVLSGLGLHAALEGAIAELEDPELRCAWLRWLEAYAGGAELAVFEWPGEWPQSRELAALLAALLKSGAPAAAALSDVIRQIDDDRQAALEESLAALPTRLSLIFCATLAPAVFLILAGGLWPMFDSLWM